MLSFASQVAWTASVTPQTHPEESMRTLEANEECNIISALLYRRVWGTRFAEIPFIVTKTGYRRGGNMRLLMQASSSCLGNLLQPKIRWNS